MYVIGLKNPPGRAVTEPPTQVTVKGPREGFTEDIKTNLGLVRKRLKSSDLHIKLLSSGRQSATAVALCYIRGVCREGVPEQIEENIKKNKIDLVPDSSYISSFITKHPRSLFKHCGSCEKPDIFCAKLCEGRAGIIVDGSPIALTAPYMVVEDFQSAEDYYITSYRATIIRALRLAAVLMVAAAVASCEDEEPATPPRPTPETTVKTVLMYFPWASDLTSFFYKNIADMGQAVASSAGDSVRVLVYMCTSATEAKLYELVPQGSTCIHEPIKEYQDPAYTTAAGIASMLADVRAAAPAPRYAMTVGCHGMGWVPVARSRSPRPSSGAEKGSARREIT